MGLAFEMFSFLYEAFYGKTNFLGNLTKQKLPSSLKLVVMTFLYFLCLFQNCKKCFWQLSGNSGTSDFSLVLARGG